MKAVIWDPKGVVGDVLIVAICGRRQCKRWGMSEMGLLSMVKRELRLGCTVWGTSVLWK